MSYSELYDLENFLATLTPRIETDLPAWYGRNAKLTGAPAFQSRHWSFFFRYEVQVSETQTAAILVKLRHLEHMTVADAAIHERMGLEIQDEYESLQRIDAVFSNHADASRFATIRPLAWYRDLNAIVMEEADIRTLKSFFHEPAMWIEGKARRRFEHFLEGTGHWLRIYQDHSGPAGKGPLYPKSLYEGSLEKINLIQTAAPHIDLRFAKDLLKSLYNVYGQGNFPYKILHNNFSINNVFITGCDEKICSFDPHNKPGPLYYDLAKLSVDMESSSLQVAVWGLSVPRSRLKSFNEALLRGYFQGGPVDYAALNLFRFLVLIEKWERLESNRMRASGKRKYIYRIGARYMQAYYLHLLRRQAAETHGLQQN
jgi:hypothetical protein